MTVIIVVFITLSLMGSALWILPSKSDRQKMSLRMRARQLGLSVQLTSIDLPDKWDKIKSKQNACAYSIFRHKAIDWQGSDILVLPYEVWKYQSIHDQCWSSHELMLAEEEKNTLKQCAGLFYAVTVTAKTVDFYWREKGQESDVENIFKLLKMLEKIRV